MFRDKNAGREKKIISNVCLDALANDIVWQNITNDVSAMFQLVLGEGYASKKFDSVSSVFREVTTRLNTLSSDNKTKLFREIDHSVSRKDLITVFWERLKSEDNSHWFRVSTIAPSNDSDVVDKMLLTLVDTLFYRFRSQDPFNISTYTADYIRQRAS